MAEDAPTLDSVIEALDQRSAATAQGGEAADVLGRGEVGAPTPGAAVAAGRAPTLDDVIGELDMRAAKERGDQPIDATRPEFALMGPGGTALAEAANMPVIGGLVREFAKSGITALRQTFITGPLPMTAATLGAIGGRERLDQKPLEEVKAERDRIAAEQAEVQQRLHTAIQSGTETNFDQIMMLSAQNADLDRLKKEND